MRWIPVTAVCLLVQAAAFAGIAQTRPADIEWSAKDQAGNEVHVPAEGRPVVLAFLKGDQPQSREAITQLKLSGLAPVVVLSGPEPGQVEVPWPIVLDPDYRISGKMGVKSWPTTVIVNGAGDTLGHVAGLGKSFLLEVMAYHAFAAGDIDRAGLEKRLGDFHVVGDTADQAAQRHLQMARRLIARGRVDLAESELNAGLKLDEQNPSLRLAMVQVMVLKEQPKEARQMLESIPAGSAPANQLALAKGRVLSADGDLAGAEESFKQALKLNPEPFEAHYEMGKVLERQSRWQEAAEHYRKACESVR